MVANRRMRSIAGAAAVWAVGVLMLSGCATKGFVKSEVAGARGYTDTQVGTVRGEVDQVRTRSDDAMTKATLAERLPSGQVDYNEVSSHQVQFAFDDYRLNPEAQSLLDGLVTELGSHPSYILEIRGFADATGSERYNYKLGRERADAVVRYLMRHSVPTARIVTVSFGEEEPVADNSSRDGRAQNRRVQARLLEIKAQGMPTAVVP